METLAQKEQRFADHFREILKEDRNLTDHEVETCDLVFLPGQDENGNRNSDAGFNYCLSTNIMTKISETTKQRLKDLWDNPKKD